MAVDYKIRIYQLSINKKESCTDDLDFRNFVSKEGKKISLSDAKYLGGLIKVIYNNISKNKWYTGGSKSKALSFITKNNYIVDKIFVDRNIDSSIYGIYSGGRYNKSLSASELSDTSKRKKLKKDDVIYDKFVFYLYAPKSSTVAILFSFSYSNDSMDDILTEAFRNIFKIDNLTFKCSVTNYINHDEKRDLIENGLSDVIQLNGTQSTNYIDENSSSKVQDYEISVRIKLNSKANTSNLKKIVNSIINDKFNGFKVKGDSKATIRNRHTVATVNLNDGKLYRQYKFESDFLQLNAENQVINFEPVFNFCRDKLTNEIIPYFSQKAKPIDHA